MAHTKKVAWGAAAPVGAWWTRGVWSGDDGGALRPVVGLDAAPVAFVVAALKRRLLLRRRLSDWRGGAVRLIK